MSEGRRMTPVDTTWLRMDRPNNRMVIVGVIILREPVDLDRVERTLAARFLAHDRFRQKVENAAGGFWWRDDERFDIGRHIRRARLPGAAGKAELQQFVADLAVRPFDPAHPLWQAHIVERYDEGVAILLRIHHAIGDGVALMHVLLDLTDDEPNAPMHGVEQVYEERDDPYSPPWEALAPLIEAVESGVRASAGAVGSALGLALRPARALNLMRDGVNVAAELAYLLLMPMDSPTRLKGPLRGDKKVAWSPRIPLPEVKAVGHALGCTVNDMLLASFAGAINAYLTEKGDLTHGVEVRALVPIDLRPPGRARELGNRFGIVAVELPVGIRNPLSRLSEVRRRMRALKKSYEPVVTLGLFEALGYGPKILQDRLFDLLLSRATVVMTNVPGPQRPLYLGGAEIDQMMFWVPQSGAIGMGVSLLSFNNHVQLGLITDTALTPEPDEIIKHFQPEFEKLLYHVLLDEWEGHKPATPNEVQTKAVRKTRRKPAVAPKAETEAAAPVTTPKRPRKPAPARHQDLAAPAQPVSARPRLRPRAKIRAKTRAKTRTKTRGSA
ncbi:wax ester/triacylglycerol synthase family O-acyltransferase [Rhodoblastus sp.]|uniref:wax ester/triacylglycerol synthase family O-acyltransferase n=1 Tax=Rhodoblastus sp. TaxID=1962975 RepID=UPI003F9742B6